MIEAINTQRIKMIEHADWITSPNDGILSKGQWRLHMKRLNGGQTTIYGKTLIELLDNAIETFNIKK